MAKKEEKKESIDNEKTIALRMAMDAIQKQFGKGSIMCLDENSPVESIDAISTGSLGLDNAIGIGGWPRGRLIELYGFESSGKTQISLQAIKEAQSLGETCAFIDAEHALDINYAKKLGIQVDKLLISQPMSGNEALEIVDMLVRSKTIAIIVVDSVAALTPKEELEGEMGQSFMGLQARLMSQACRKLTANIAKSNTMVIMINQIRQKLMAYGDPNITTSGNALKFYSSVRAEVKKKDIIKDGDTIIGQRMRVKIVKNKVSIPFKECEFDFIYGKGINRTGELVDMAEERGIIKKSGAWFSYKEDNIGQGRDKTIIYLDSNPNIKKEIEDELTMKQSAPQSRLA